MRSSRARRLGVQPQQILASQDTYDLFVERGEQDKASEIGRFPRLLGNVESVPPGIIEEYPPEYAADANERVMNNGVRSRVVPHIP